MTDANPVKILYTEGESGWAIPLADGRYVIDNVPLDDELRYGDIVTVKDTEFGPMVDEVVERKYAHTVTVKYMTTNDYDIMRKRIESLDAVIEGGTAPTKGRQGMALLNYDDIDIDALLEGTSARIWD